MRWILTLLATLLLALPLSAQTDISVPWVGPFGDIGRGLTWAGAGRGSINNAWVIDLPAPQTSACLFIHNNAAANRFFRLHVFSTSDQAAHTYYLNPTVWEPLSIVSANSGFLGFPGSGLYTVGSPATTEPLLSVFSVTPASGGRIAFVIESTGGAGTADVFYTFGSPSPCSAFIPSDAQIFTEVRTVAAGTIVIPWVGNRPEYTGGITIYPGAPQNWSTCSFYYSATNTAGAGPTLNTYIQSYDHLTIIVDDRVSFLQAGVAPSYQAAELIMDGPQVPHLALNATLAAGTTVAGVFSDTMQVTYVTVGVGASFDVRMIAICH